MTSTDACRLTGATFRQLDFWVSNGYIRARDRVKDTSGVNRHYDRREIIILSRMVRLTRVGVAAAQAARIARYSVESNQRTVLLPERITVVFERPAVDGAA